MMPRALWMVLIAAPLFAQEMTVATWNVRILSSRSRDAWELDAIAGIIGGFDLVAVQEVRDEAIVASLLSRLPEWRAEVSPPSGRGGQTERQAFMWGPKVEITSVRGLAVDSLDSFARDPFEASFRMGKFDATLISVHVVYGSYVRERRDEILALVPVYRQALSREQDVLLVGDFNLPPLDSGMAPLWDWLGLIPAILYEPTTVRDGDVLDNLWISVGTAEWTGRSGVVRFDEDLFEGDDDVASLAVSDHRPAWASFHDWMDDDPGSTVIRSTSWAQVKK